MKIFLLDDNEDSREILVERVTEALRQLGLRRVQLVEGTTETLSSQVGDEAPNLAFLGPGCYSSLEETLKRFRSVYPTAPVGIILSNEIYASEAVELRKAVAARIMPVADIAQVAQFILDAEGQSGENIGGRNRGVISVVQFKGGVGASSVAASLASCWARHELRVALVDLDDVSPQITNWARVGPSQRKRISDLLKKGTVPEYRADEIVQGLEEYDGRLMVVGQPERYAESFHFKADILEDSPSASEFVDSLLESLQQQFDVVVVDTGRSWGISTFATLAQSQHVLMVVNDNRASLEQSLSNFVRLFQESDDSNEFDLSKWGVVLNGHSGRNLNKEDVSYELEEVEIFPEALPVHVVPLSQRGQNWGVKKVSLFELGDEEVSEVLRNLAFSLIPFRYERGDSSFFKRLKGRFEKLVS